MKTKFRRLVRVEVADGSITYAEAGDHVKVGDTLQAYTGNEPWAIEDSGKTVEVAKVVTSLLVWLLATHSHLDPLPVISYQHLLWYWLEL